MRLLGGFLSIGLVVVATTGGADSSLSAAESPKTEWHDSFEDAQKAAQSLGKPLLIHFHATWCGPCQQMEQSVLNTETVKQQLGQRVVGVKINTDSRPDLSSKYGVGSLPSDVFVAPDGSVLARDGGATSVDSYKRRIISVSNRFIANRLYQLFAGTQTPADAIVPTAESDDSTPAVGLSGYSPVSIVETRKWQKGSSEFSYEHAGVVYHLASADELAKFKADPKKYTPAWLGHDPLELVSTLDHVAGDIRYAALYRSKLYLLSSKQNQTNFIANPDAYEDTTVRKQ